MPHLCGSLPFIDHATQMRMDHNTEIEVETEVERAEETNPTTSNIESLKSKIQMAQEALQCLKQGLGTFDCAIIWECIQTLN